MAIGLGIFMGALDMSIINISLPTLMIQLETRFVAVQWIVIAYILIITSAMMGAARLGDMYEKKCYPFTKNSASRSSSFSVIKARASCIA